MRRGACAPVTNKEGLLSDIDIHETRIPEAFYKVFTTSNDLLLLKIIIYKPSIQSLVQRCEDGYFGIFTVPRDIIAIPCGSSCFEELSPSISRFKDPKSFADVFIPLVFPNTRHNHSNEIRHSIYNIYREWTRSILPSLNSERSDVRSPTRNSQFEGTQSG